MFKQLHKKISISFFNKLSILPAYKAKPKAISAAYYFLTKVADYNQMNHGAASSVARKLISDLFLCYDRSGNYAKYLEDLIKAGLVKTNGQYLTKKNDRLGKGICKKYLVTESGLTLLNDLETDYLDKLINDSKTRRAVKNHKFYMKNNTTTYGDYVLDYLADFGRNVVVNVDAYKGLLGEVNQAMIDSGDSSLTVLASNRFNNTIVNNLISGNLRDLRRNETDGRIWNEYVGMKSDYRMAIQYKNLKPVAVLDIRACHPSFFGLYLQSVIKDSSTISNEVTKWNNLWFNPSIDAREIIAKDIGTTKGAVKQMVNETINGSRQHKQFLAWLMLRFPDMYKAWQGLNVKATGNAICERFETVLMLDKTIYQLADSLGVKLSYEYDGMTIFAPELDSAKVQDLLEHIQSLAVEKFGVKPVMSVEII